MFKKSLIPAVCMLVSACGFTPLYSTSGGLWSKTDDSITEETAKVFVAPISEHSGQVMREQLIALLSGQKKAEKEYILQVHNTENVISEQGYTTENVPTRITIGITSAFTLSKGDKVLLSESAFAQSTYNVLQSGYSTVTAKKTLQKQLLTQLAQDIALRVGSFLKTSVVQSKQSEETPDKQSDSNENEI